MEKDKPIIYLFQAKRFLEQANLIPPQHIHPCTLIEVATLETKLGLRLPEAFREFLLWCGKGLRGIQDGSNFYYHSMMQFDHSQWARDLLQENGFDSSLLNDNVVVFWVHQGYQFAYFDVTEGDDPAIYYYCEGDEGVKKIYDHFSEYFYTLIEDGNQHAGLAYIYQFDDIYNLPIYDIRVTSLSFNGTFNFKNVPDRVFDFVNLNRLNLGHKGLITLSARIGELTQLQWLNVTNNALIELPEAMTALSNLKTLHLSHNQLQTVPNILRQLPSLQEVSLEGNSLQVSEVELLKIELPDVTISF